MSATNDWVYGFHAVEGVLRHEPRRVRALYLQDGRRDKRAQALEALAANQGVALHRCQRADLDAWVSGRHQGIAAEVEPRIAGGLTPETELPTLIAAADCPLLLILDGVTDPHNLGACLRSADAAGVTAVIVPKNRSADLGPVVSKVACGAAETVPFVRVTNLSRTLAQLKGLGVWIVGTTGDADQLLYQQDLTLPLALIMGAEGEGMRRLTTEGCDFTVSLPMQGTVSSLNVSVATGICLFEVLRQRGGV